MSMRGIHMKIFISWSGDTSLRVAVIFRDWLPSVIQSVEPYVSSEDIDKGARWSTDIAKELENSTFGILCVTKENLKAPWLSFEAGALSKTMEKSFVTPFLFDIKRSEVQGPILQFQSTIFQKDDIKKMVQTINKASGDSGISEQRLNKSFDVWYPTLEEELTKIKNNSSNTTEDSMTEDTSHSSEILEEILELSRDNQKLLRNPDSKLHDDIEKVNEALERLSMKNDIQFERKRISRKYDSIFFDEIMHMSGKRSSSVFLMTLSLLKEDFPWIYDMGKELIDILKKEKDPNEKSIAIKEFREMMNFTFSHPMIRDIYGRNTDSIILIKELPYSLMRYLDAISEQYN